MRAPELLSARGVDYCGLDVLLAIDIGNTNLAFGLYEGERLVQTFRAQSVRNKTADEYAVLLRQMLTLHNHNPSQVEAAIIASVVPPLTESLSSAVRQAFAREPITVGPGLKTGISVLYENTRDVGADRVVNSVAAYHRFKSGVIVVDFGTATTFDCVSPKAEYLGGVIVPGVEVSLDGLIQRASKLSGVEIVAPPKIVGRSTPHALQSGVVYGYASLVDGLLTKIRAELDFPCEVIGTGGLATLISEHADLLTEVDQNLTLQGLQLLHQRNCVSSR